MRRCGQEESHCRTDVFALTTSSHLVVCGDRVKRRTTELSQRPSPCDWIKIRMGPDPLHLCGQQIEHVGGGPNSAGTGGGHRHHLFVAEAATVSVWLLMSTRTSGVDSPLRAERIASSSCSAW